MWPNVSIMLGRTFAMTVLSRAYRKVDDAKAINAMAHEIPFNFRYGTLSVVSVFSTDPVFSSGFGCAGSALFASVSGVVESEAMGDEFTLYYCVKSEFLKVSTAAAVVDGDGE